VTNDDGPENRAVGLPDGVPDGETVMIRLPGGAAQGDGGPVMVRMPGGGEPVMIRHPDGGEPVMVRGAAGHAVTMVDGEPVVIRAAAAPRLAPVADAQGVLDGREVELRSDELEAIISRVPSWLVRWGITCIAGTLLVMLAVGSFVRYPEMVRGRAVLTTHRPPVRLVSRVGGEVKYLFVADGERVRAGALLAVLNNPADHRDVLRLARHLDGEGGALPGLSLGDVQPAYAEYVRSVSDLHSFEAGRYYHDKAAALGSEAEVQRRLGRTLEQEHALRQAELRIADRERARSRELAARGLLSPAEVERAEEAYLQKQRMVGEGNNQILNSELQTTQRRAALLDLEQTRAEELRRFQVAARTATANLRAEIAEWEQAYLLTAPSAGRVSFFKPLSQNQFIAANETVLAVVPDGGAVIGRVQVRESTAGRVRVGQRVILSLDAFPPGEFGTLQARVQSVSLLAFREDGKDDPVYLVDLALPGGMVTTYGKTIPFRPEMPADARVVTAERSLIGRVFNHFRELVDGGRRS